MIKKFTNIFLMAVLITAAIFLQSINFDIKGIRPNLVLVLLLILAFKTADFLLYAVFVFFSALMIRFYPGFSWELLVFIFIFLGIFWLRHFLTWRDSLNFLILIAVATLGLYIFINPVFIYRHFDIAAKELIYNLLIGAALFLLFKILSIDIDRSRFKITD